MTDLQNTDQFTDQAPDRRNRKFSVSANRGKASQKVRYVEAGGAAVDTEECAFCQSMPDLSDEGSDERDKQDERKVRSS